METLQKGPCYLGHLSQGRPCPPPSPVPLLSLRLQKA